MGTATPVSTFGPVIILCMAIGCSDAGSGAGTASDATPMPTGAQDNGAPPQSSDGAQDSVPPPTTGGAAADTPGAMAPPTDPGGLAGDSQTPDANAPDGSETNVDSADAGMATASDPVVCPAQALVPGTTQHSIQVGGVMRGFILQVPDGYTGDTPLPLVVDFHPLFGSGSSQRGSSGYRELANREGFIVAWPDGIDGAWDIGPCCVDADDEGFARALVEEIRAQACVDPKRIYAAGYSMGGGMSHFLACSVGDVFAAVAPAAFDLVEEMTCEPSRPISVLLFRGTTDFIVPYRGGPSTPPNGYPMMITFLGAEGSFERWAELNHCTGAPTDTGGGCQTYDECEAGVEVTLCTATGGGHVTGDPERGWEMFQRQVMP